jgi:hypothetical protein
MTDSLKSKTHTADPVVLIKTYTVPSEEADYFTEAYQENARIMSRQPGCVRSRLETTHSKVRAVPPDPMTPLHGET